MMEKAENYTKDYLLGNNRSNAQYCKVDTENKLYE
jgi:hypothetical protein